MQVPCLCLTQHSLVTRKPGQAEVLVSVGQAASNHKPCGIEGECSLYAQAVAIAGVDLVQQVTRVRCGTSCMYVGTLKTSSCPVLYGIVCTWSW